MHGSMGWINCLTRLVDRSMVDVITSNLFQLLVSTWINFLQDDVSLRWSFMTPIVVPIVTRTVHPPWSWSSSFCFYLVQDCQLRNVSCCSVFQLSMWFQAIRRSCGSLQSPQSGPFLISICWVLNGWKYRQLLQRFDCIPDLILNFDWCPK